MICRIKRTTILVGKLNDMTVFDEEDPKERE